MNTRSSPFFLFLVGFMTFSLVLLAVVFSHLYRKAVPNAQDIPDAGKALISTSDPVYTSFEKGEDFKKLNAQSSKHLESYGYTNLEKGLVHIPIQRAIELYLKQKASK